MQPVSYYTRSTQTECGICYEEKADKAHTGTCGDANPICEECITTHLLKSETCPFCRAPVDLNSLPSVQERKFFQIQIAIEELPDNFEQGQIRTPRVWKFACLSLGMIWGGGCGHIFSQSLGMPSTQLVQTAVFVGAAAGTIFAGILNTTIYERCQQL